MATASDTTSSCSSTNSRRRFLGTTARAAAGDDAALLALGGDWRTTAGRIDDGLERAYELEQATEEPPLPDAMYWRQADGRFWPRSDMCSEEMIDGETTGRFSYLLRAGRLQAIDKAIKAAPDFYPVAKARRIEEILAAKVEWDRVRDAAAVASGLYSVRQALLAELARGKALRSEIVRTPASTLEGILVKAAVAHWCLCGEDFDEEFEAALASDADVVSDAVTMSLVRDLVALGGGSGGDQLPV